MVWDTPWLTVTLQPESLLTMGSVCLTKMLLLFKRLGIKMFRNNSFFDHAFPHLHGADMTAVVYLHPTGSSYMTAISHLLLGGGV